MAVAAEVLQVIRRLGVKGVSRVKCKVIEGDDKDKILTRNVIGPIKIGDVILLKDTAMDTEAKLQKR